MEWLIPVHELHIDQIQIGSITHTAKPLIPLSYKESEHTFPSLSILLPSLKIKSFDPLTGHFVISLAENPGTLAKLQGLQDMLLAHIKSKYMTWFPNQRINLKKSVDLKTGFQPLIHGNELHLYCPIQPQIAQSVPFYSKDTWSSNGIQTGLLTPGSKIRIVLRVQGVSFHIHQTTGHWTGKFRIQHKLLALLMPNCS
jgi:hypothetical protein